MKKWWRALASVAAAAFGVQSDKNRADDFERLSAISVVIASVVFTLLFIGGLVLVVTSVTP